jgi:hypothetical protein
MQVLAVPINGDRNLMSGLNWAKADAQRQASVKGIESINGRRLPPAGTTYPRQRSKRKSAAGSQRTIAEVDKFWRDRSGRAIVTRLTEYGGYSLVDVRTFFTADNGTLQPAKGLALGVRLLPQLIRSLQKAEDKARELGLIDDGAGHE